MKREMMIKTPHDNFKIKTVKIMGLIILNKEKSNEQEPSGALVNYFGKEKLTSRCLFVNCDLYFCQEKHKLVFILKF